MHYISVITFTKLKGSNSNDFSSRSLNQRSKFIELGLEQICTSKFIKIMLFQLRKQNREMEQTLEIVDEENAKIRREMDRTNSQLATFTTWVQSRQLL